MPTTPLPETIGSHPWYLYVDASIDPEQLKYVTGVLEAEYYALAELFNLLKPPANGDDVVD